MMTVEERLEVEQLKNKILLRLLKCQLGSDAIKRLEVTLSCMDKLRGEDPEYFEKAVRRIGD